MKPNRIVWRVGFLAVLFGTGLLYGIRLGDRALWSEEVRWAEIPLEMTTTGDYLWPTINGHSYYDKPLGSYWLVLAAAWLPGEVNEWAARFPSAVSGLLAVAMLMLIGRRLYGERAALIAGIVLATSFGFAGFARTASADSETVAGVLVALWLCLRNEERGGGRWVIGLWGVMALTSLTKGLLGFVLPILVFGVYRMFSTGPFFTRQRWFFNWVTPAAIVLGVLIYAVPFVMSIRQTGADAGFGMVWRENVRRFFDSHNHRGPIYLYFYVVIGLAAPWVALLPAALAQAIAKRDRFALAYFISVFVFFTLSSSRRSYYLLPILPAVALLIGRLLATPCAELTAWSQRFAKAGFWSIAGFVLLGVGAFVVPMSALPTPWNMLPPLPVPLAFAGVWLSVIGMMIFTAKQFTMQRLAASFALLAFGSMAYLFWFAQPAIEGYRTEKPFLLEVRGRLGAEISQLALYRTRETVYYLAPGQALVEADDATDVRKVLATGHVRWLLARERNLPDVGFAGRVIARQTVQPWEDVNVQGSKLVLIEVSFPAR